MPDMLHIPSYILIDARQIALAHRNDNDAWYMVGPDFDMHLFEDDLILYPVSYKDGLGRPTATDFGSPVTETGGRYFLEPRPH